MKKKIYAVIFMMGLIIGSNIYFVFFESDESKYLREGGKNIGDTFFLIWLTKTECKNGKIDYSNYLGSPDDRKFDFSSLSHSINLKQANMLALVKGVEFYQIKCFNGILKTTREL